MGILTYKDLRNAPRPRRRGVGPINLPARGVLFLASTDQFAAILLLERKRTDRSGRPFLFMLLDIEAALKNDLSRNLLKRITRAISTSIRDTDSLGWHVRGTMLGVLFTELNVDDLSSVGKVIEARVRSALALHLEPKELAGIRFSLQKYPDDWGKADGTPPDFGLYPDLTKMHETRKFSQLVKRSIDVAGSAAALLVLSPLLALIALLVRLTSEGPALFRQTRVGQYGYKFPFLKFRTMYCTTDESLHKKYVQQFIAGNSQGAEKAEGKGPVYKIRNDRRVTRLGRFLRKTSLDELPQLLNVLKGEMSLVGPRPPIPYEVQCYDTWHRRRLLEVKPGITGLWQVCGRSRTRFDDMVRLDLQYARSWSVWLDLKILFRTPHAVISGDGAY